jgi:hypothetical protein
VRKTYLVVFFIFLCSIYNTVLTRFKEDLENNNITLSSLSTQILENLPEYKTLSTDQENKNFVMYLKNYKTPITREYFQDALEMVVKQYHNKLEKKELWFNKYKKLPTRAYEQKCNLNTTLPTIVIGDLHGNIHSLLRILWKLVILKLINDNFETKCNIIFLGDYVDRAPFGAEVLYLITILKIINEDKIILTKGNHENEKINELKPIHGGFKKEIEQKFNIPKVNQFLKSYITPFYNYLPLNSFVAFDKNYIISFRHGGITPQKNQTINFLSNEKTLFNNIDTKNFYTYDNEKYYYYSGYKVQNLRNIIKVPTE